MTSQAPAATILIVDDDEMNRQMLSLRLRRRGIAVLLAQHGYEALQVLARHPVDLLLLDVLMPGLNGLDVLKLIRKTRTMTELPIIMTTAMAESQDVVDALGLGANDYLVKPIDFAVLLARIQVQLRIKGLAEAGAGGRGAPDSEPPPVGPGTILDGKYRLDDLLGSGGSGTVFRASHLLLGHGVAVKILRTAVGSRPELRARFQREGVAACRVRHPNAVAILDFAVTDSGLTYLVMELLEGHSLAQELRAAGPLAAARCVEILLPICDVLAEAHADGIVHRDLKPANIFVQTTRQGEVIKVVDFGIAKLLDDEARAPDPALTLAGHVLGTPAYMAPERLLRRPYDGGADVYALGVMLYQMLAGRLPFQAPDGDPLRVALMHVNDPPPPLGAWNPQVTPALEAVVLSALAKDPTERPPARDLAQRFAAAARSRAGRRVGEMLPRPPAARPPAPGAPPAEPAGG